MNNKNISEILIIRPAALGDTLMLLPALSMMREAGSTVVVGRKSGMHYLRPFVQDCLDFEGNGWHGLFMEPPGLADLPRAGLVVAFLRDAEGIVRNNLHSLFPGSRVCVYAGLPESAEGIHAGLHLAGCLRTAGIDLEPEECIQRAMSRPLLQDGIPEEKKDAVVFHPGSGGKAKNHPPEFWLELTQAFCSDPLFSGLRSFVLLGPAEEHLLPCFASNSGGVRQGDIVISPKPEALTALLRQSAIYLGHDSGVTHLAAMLGVPTIALFRESSVSMWRPLGPNVAVLQEGLPGERLLPKILQEAARLMRRP